MRISRAVAIVAGVSVLGVAGLASANALSPAASHIPSLTAAASPSAGRVIPTVVSGGNAPDAGFPPGPGCGYTKAVPFDRYKGLPNFTKAAASEPYLAVLHTTQGTISFRAEVTKAPCTTYSFRFLANRNFYDNTHCHRLTVKGIYVLQCGDPTGTGSGGPGYRFNDENLKGATYPAGTVAMANAGPNTNGSQFFFCWKNTTLAPDYTPFGQVVSGLGVLQKIARAGDDSQNGPGDGYPHLYVGIKKVAIIKI